MALRDHMLCARECAMDVDQHYASREQLRAMSAAGLTVGARSIHQRLLSQLSDAEQEREVLGSLQSLSELVGEPVSTAHPRRGSSPDDGGAAWARRTGMLVA